MARRSLTLREKLAAQGNDYSQFEPFGNANAISSSIIIPVYNGFDMFRYTLRNLVQHPEIVHNSDLFEIVVVDDGSDDDIEGLVKTTEFPCLHAYVRSDSNQGRSFSRNRGIRLSNNDLLFLMDSDVLLPHNYFAEHWKIHNSCPVAVGAGLAENIALDDSRIRVLTNGGDVVPDVKKDFRHYKDTSKFIEQQNRGIYRLLSDTDSFKKFGHQMQLGTWTLPLMVVTHNLSVRKSKALFVGGFDERFKGWGYEDSFFGAKLISEGCYVIPVMHTGAFRIKHQPRFGTEKIRQQEMTANLALYERLLDERVTDD